MFGGGEGRFNSDGVPGSRLATGTLNIIAAEHDDYSFTVNINVRIGAPGVGNISTCTEVVLGPLPPVSFLLAVRHQSDEQFVQFP